MSAPAELALGGSLSRREMMLWGAAGLVVLLAHSAFALAFNKATLFSPPPEAAEQAMEIELTPLPVTLPEIVGAESFVEPVPTERIEPMEDEPAVEEAVPEEIQPVDPELAMAEPPEPDVLTPTETVEAEPVETVEAEPEPVDAVEAEQAEPEPVETETIEAIAPEPEIVEQPVPDTIMPEVALAVPTPKPVIEPVEEEEPRPKQAKPREKPKERAAERKPVEKAQPKKVAEKPADKSAKVAKAKPPSSASSRASKASKAPKIKTDRWNDSVWAAISRRLHRSRIGRATLTVNFVVNSSGAVVSARIGRSSGDGSIDAAVLRAVRSVRLPLPPAGTGKSTHNFTVPVTFN